MRLAGASLGLAFGLLGAATAVSVTAAEGLLTSVLTRGHGVALTADERARARALGRSVEALAAGEISRARKALALAEGDSRIADHVALQKARVLAAAGKWDASISVAIAARIEYPYSPVDVALLQRIGDGRVAQGRETSAQRAFETALAETDDPALQRVLKLEIVASRQRIGELDAAANPADLLALAFPESARPEEVPAGERSAEMALQLADERVAEGRGSEAVEAFREALAGELQGAERRRARMQMGIALFGLRRYDEAITAFGVLGDEPEARYWYARSLARTGKLQASIAEFVSLAETAPPELAHRSAYLAATLLEDRGETARAMALYEKVAANQAFAERAGHAQWRIGWSAWHRRDYDEARARFLEMIERGADPLAQLRPRYWAARAVEASGDARTGREELGAIARDWPLAYYGWRAQQRLGKIDPRALMPAPDDAPAPGEDSVSQAELQRIALLLEAGQSASARTELAPLADRATSRADRVQVGRLLVLAGDYHRAQRLVVDVYGVPLAHGVRSGEEELFWLSWPPAYREQVMTTLPKSGHVEPALIWAIMREESSFRPAVMSSAGAIGLLQLMPETAARTAKRAGRPPIGDVEELFEPATNIALGSAYLDHLVGRFPGRLSAAIGSYNAGPNAVARWLVGPAAEREDDVWVEDIPYGQTRKYVKRVLRSLHAYRTFY
ncbi:MAG: transglycosylase SLT domain-containing protein [Deltaproteobacteria bacterium]|nr:transglycosylase SLT domain-containing protein [Deltaproteobacteria bacterium]